jgi:hypothetical protein
VRTRAQPKPGSLRLVGPMWLDLPLPGLRVWVPKRIIPRLGALTVVSVRAKRTQFFDCGLGTDVPWADHAKQTQFAPAGKNRWGKPHPTRAQLRQTNPIRPSGLAWSLERETVRKKPNLGGMGHLGDGASGRLIVQNKANLAGRPGALEGEMCETKPILPGLGRTKSRMDERCKTNPIWAARLLSGRSIVRNKPNSSCRPAPRRAKGAKRTQFGLLPWGRGGPDAPNEANCCPSDRYTARPSASYEDCACRCHPAPRGTYRATSPRCPASGNKANGRVVRYGAGSYFVRTCPPGGRSRMGLPWR